MCRRAGPRAARDKPGPRVQFQFCDLLNVAKAAWCNLHNCEWQVTPHRGVAGGVVTAKKRAAAGLGVRARVGSRVDTTEGGGELTGNDIGAGRTVKEPGTSPGGDASLHDVCPCTTQVCKETGVGFFVRKVDLRNTYAVTCWEPPGCKCGPSCPGVRLPTQQRRAHAVLPIWA